MTRYEIKRRGHFNLNSFYFNLRVKRCSLESERGNSRTLTLSRLCAAVGRHSAVLRQQYIPSLPGTHVKSASATRTRQCSRCLRESPILWYSREERLCHAHQTVQQVFEGESDAVCGHAREAGGVGGHHRADVTFRGQRLLSVPRLLPDTGGKREMNQCASCV